ncbi:hypothetical protein [Pseudomonas protegens]|uniref:hypothetical protein n=1 Tax=Pseudomonas protegens TaxID=380021 RepID=UPI0038280B24
MAFRTITDRQGNQIVVNSDCIAIVEPAGRGGWANGGEISFKPNSVPARASIDIDGAEAAAVREWLTGL